MDHANAPERKTVEPMRIESRNRFNSAAHDDIVLSRLGKKPVLRRNFGFMAILGFSCTILITWEGFLTIFGTGLSNGGPAGVVYGYLLVWLGTLSNFIVLSELASMAPISGGQYHWVAMLAPKSHHRFASYVTGWLTVLGWQAVVASGGLLSGTTIQGLMVLCNNTYSPKAWHATLLFWASVLFAAFINSVVSGLLPKFESSIFVLHIAGFFGVLIPLVYLGPHDSVKNVFTTFLNSGGWPTQGVSFFVGIIGNVFAFFGADGAIHMSEEIQNAQVVVPQSIITAIIINGTLGFGMVLALLFCLGDLNTALESPTGYPFMEIFRQAVQSDAGAAIMSSVVVIMTLSATVGSLASASRILWSFSRDRMVPGWAFLQEVNTRTAIPLRAVATTVILSCLLALINIGSAAVFYHIISLSVAGIFSSYLITTSLFLWRRCRGDIHHLHPADAAATASDTPLPLTNVPGAPLTWGPWRCPGWLGIANNVFSVVYISVIFFFSFWPSGTPVAPATMNYSVVMFGATLLFSAAYYVLHARKTYMGPVVDLGGFAG